VTLYAAKNCPPCDVGRDLLVQRGIPFAEKRVDTQPDLEAYVKFSGGRTLPC
jgi:glutaredoxin